MGKINVKNTATTTTTVKKTLVAGVSTLVVGTSTLVVGG